MSRKVFKEAFDRNMEKQRKEQADREKQKAAKSNGAGSAAQSDKPSDQTRH